jgi:DNA repair protein RecN (Recombination protein N)
VLSALDIRNVVLIEALSLDFAKGLGVLTGETGAGKSILLDSLGLALGARGDVGLVRSGAQQAQVSAVFSLPPAHPAITKLAEHGLSADAGELVLRRLVRVDGGSRAFVNDQPVSAGLLREIGELVVEIHGQHDDRGLLNPAGHRALVDAYGSLDVARCVSAWQRWRTAEQQLADARASLEEGLRNREFLEHAIAELGALAPEAGEEAALAARRADMLKGQKIAEDLETVGGAFDGGDSALAALRTTARRLERIAADHDLLAQMLGALDRAIVEAGEAEDLLRQAREALAYDPAELDAVERRLFDLRGMARKHRVEPDALSALAKAFETQAAAIVAGEDGLKALAAAATAARDGYVAAADALSAARKTAATRLDKAISAELLPLKLDEARFRTRIDPLADGDWGPYGRDRVAFEIATNPGAPFGPLSRIASGGELSRFILALKVALAETRPVGTIIFDEIDRGVGGAVASAIGDRLARLAEGAQVLVVTHSPQVAARAMRQFRIAKHSNGKGTRTEVTALDAAERREEIARMLSGAEITDEARAQADRLLG